MRILVVALAVLWAGCMPPAQPGATTAGTDRCAATCPEGDAACRTYTYEALQRLCWLRDAASWVFVSATAMTSRPAAARSYEVNVDRAGSDYRSFSDRALDAAMCDAACARESECKAWSFDGRADQTPTCNLKSAVPDKTPALDMVSGLKAGDAR